MVGILASAICCVLLSSSLREIAIPFATFTQFYSALEPLLQPSINGTGKFKIAFKG